MKTTFSIIKADVGGWPGHAAVHPDLKKIANRNLNEAKRSHLLKDFYITALIANVISKFQLKEAINVLSVTTF